MSRRYGLEGWAIASIGVLSALSSTPSAGSDDLRDLGARGRAAGYHVLLITLDTVRADYLGCYGRAQARTPTLDALADPGIRYETAIAPAPITLPSHATMLTGLDVPEHGARNNGTSRVDASVTTLAEILGGTGYETAAFVAAYVLDSRYGLDQGFDRYDDDLETGEDLTRRGHINRRAGGDVTDAALAWMSESFTGETPAFAWVHYFDAHLPYTLTEDEAARFPQDPYAAAISVVDDFVARLVDFLDETGVRERTLIVVTADHGESLGEHGERTHSRLVYDTTMRVPLILSCPSLFPDKRDVKDRVVSLCDIFPTVLNLLGAEFEPTPWGRDLLTSTADVDRAVYIETLAPLINNGWASLHGLRRLHDKYILAPTREFYDLRRDAAELENRYLENPDALDALVTELERRMAAWPATAGRGEELDPETARRLAALGYVGGAGAASSDGERPDPKDMIVAWEQAGRSLQLSAAGRHAEGLQLLEESLSANPNDAQAWQNAALIQQRMGRLGPALRAIRRSIDLYPTADRYVRMAQYLLLAERLDEAHAAVEKAMVLDDREGGIYVVRGQLQCARGRFDLAVPEFERALELDPVAQGATARTLIEQCQLVLDRQGR